MRKTLAPEVESARVGGKSGDGPLGAFRLLSPDSGRTLAVIASDGRNWSECGLPGGAWEHVSVSAKYGTPTWAEMCWVKSLFWEAHEWVVQFHPAESDYVNIHARCLHLWRAVGADFPTPPKECV